MNADGNDAAMQAEERKSLDYFRKACDAGVSEGCRWLGSVASDFWKSDTNLRTEGLAAYEKACDNGNASACYELGDYRLAGSNGITKDEFQGVADYQRACKLGEMLACRELGEFFFAGKHVTKDPARGLKFLGQYCEQGDAETCLELGQHLLGSYVNNDIDDPIKPVSIPDAEATGRAMLARGCKLKEAAACYELGRVNYQTKQYDQAKLYFEATLANSKGDYDDAEILLGNMLFNGQGVPANKAQAIEYWITSGDEKLMLKAATMLEKGDGVLQDAERAGVVLAEYCYDTSKKAECMRVKTLNQSAFENVMGRHCSDETAWACNEFQSAKPADYKALVEQECAKVDNDPTEFHCKRAAALR